MRIIKIISLQPKESVFCEPNGKQCFYMGFCCPAFLYNYLFWDKELLCCHLKWLNSSNFSRKCSIIQKGSTSGNGMIIHCFECKLWCKNVVLHIMPYKALQWCLKDSTISLIYVAYWDFQLHFSTEYFKCMWYIVSTLGEGRPRARSLRVWSARWSMLGQNQRPDWSY